MSSNLTKTTSPFKIDLLKNHLYGTRVLDLGAGELLYSKWITQHQLNAHVTAIDLIKQPSQDRIKYLTTDLEQPLPFEAESFDSIVAFDLIEHISNEHQLWTQLFEKLAHNGVLIGSVPHDEDLFLPAYNLTFYHRSDVTHKRYYTVKTLTKKLIKYGFSDVQVIPVGSVSPHVFAEFFPVILRWPVKKIISLLSKIGIVSNNHIASDLLFVGYKK